MRRCRIIIVLCLTCAALLLLPAVCTAKVGASGRAAGVARSTNSRGLAETTIFPVLGGVKMDANGRDFTRLGRTVKPHGNIIATDENGFTDPPRGKVQIGVQFRRPSGKWVMVKLAWVAIDPMGNFYSRYAPTRKGRYCWSVGFPGNAGYAEDHTPWMAFYVR